MRACNCNSTPPKRGGGGEGALGFCQDQPRGHPPVWRLEQLAAEGLRLEVQETEPEPGLLVWGGGPVLGYARRGCVPFFCSGGGACVSCYFVGFSKNYKRRGVASKNATVDLNPVLDVPKKEQPRVRVYPKVVPKVVPT